MLYPIDEHPADVVSPAAGGEVGSVLDGSVLDRSVLGDSILDDPALAEAVTNLRALIMAGESYRLAVAVTGGLGATESQAISYLAVHGARGQSDLARDLGLTSSAATALVDRLERHGAAERTPHPSDRRRTLIRLTTRGEELAVAGQQPLLASLGLVERTDLPLVSSWLSVIAADLHARSR
jgi:DNA-binding MarR family transcriptional regulator